MNGFDVTSPPARDRRFQPGRIAGEAALVAVVGLALALVANQISPSGLHLTTNYFPGGSETAKPVAPIVTTSSGSNTNASNPPSPTALLAARLQEKGLQLAERAEVEKLFHDPRAQQNLILFIDARDEDHFTEGHIPGAMEFYPYHPEKYMADVLPACQIAEEIVVYCTGGDCEDSQSAALFLKEAGIPGAKLRVYGGGITEWEDAKLPVELGARNSGDLRKASQ